MKSFLRVTLILLCIFSAVVSLVYMGDDNTAEKPALQQNLSPTDTIGLNNTSQSIAFSQSIVRMTQNSELTLKPDVQPAEYAEKISWSSSDEAVAKVDSEGRVTAVGSGRATITASISLCSAATEIVVGGDIKEDTFAVIKKLASDGSSFLEAQLLYEQLDSSGEAGVEEMRELMGSILAYASGSGDAVRLREAIEKSGFPETECLTAANVCWAKYEKLHSEAVISFTGDVTLARYNEEAKNNRFPAVYAASGSYTYPFDRVKGIFTSDSLTVVNFEGTLTGSTEHREKSFYFRGDPLYAGILPASGIEAAGLANNHSGDYFERGLKDTVRYLGDAGVSTFYENNTAEISVAGSSGSVPVVLVGVCCTGSTVTDETVSRTVAEIRSRKNSDNVVIVVMHWGVEGQNARDASQQEAAFAMIDAGADLIVGHHPHVLQGIEKYRGKYIVYSLANFAFGGHGAANDPQTMILRARIGRESGGLTVTGISAVPCFTTSTNTRQNNYQPCIRFGEQGRAIINDVLRYSRALEYGITELDWSEI